MTHELKILPEHFAAVKSGDKTFEVRKNDRNYQTGDLLILSEYDDINDGYTGNAICVRVSHILKGGEHGIYDKYVVMSIKNIN